MMEQDNHEEEDNEEFAAALDKETIDFFDGLSSDVDSLDLNHYRLKSVPSLARFVKLTSICLR